MSTEPNPDQSISISLTINAPKKPSGEIGYRTLIAIYLIVNIHLDVMTVFLYHDVIYFSAYIFAIRT